MFEDIDATNKVLFDFLDVLIHENESLDNLDDKKDWTKDDFLIATIQFMDFIWKAKSKFMIQQWIKLP